MEVDIHKIVTYHSALSLVAPIVGIGIGIGIYYWISAKRMVAMLQNKYWHQ